MNCHVFVHGILSIPWFVPPYIFLKFYKTPRNVDTRADYLTDNKTMNGERKGYQGMFLTFRLEEVTRYSIAKPPSSLVMRPNQLYL